MREEVLQVLRMVESKALTAEEAAKLLDALEEEPGAEAPSAGAVAAGAEPGSRTARARGAETILVHVEPLDGVGSQLDIRLPLGLARFALRNIPKEARSEMRQQGVDMDQILEQVARGTIGKIVDIRGPNFKVEVRLE